MDKAKAAANVDEYLAQQTPENQILLAELRTVIKATAPMAEEVISYQIPTYKYKGALVHFAAFKAHCSFFGVSKKLIEKYANELAPFVTQGTTIRFTPENPLPLDLVKRMVMDRIAMNDELFEMKQLAKKKK